LHFNIVVELDSFVNFVCFFQLQNAIFDKSALKGQSHEVFNPLFFFLKGTPGHPDSWAKAVLKTDLNFIFLPVAGKITYGFLIDCYFNGFCKGRKNFFLILRYVKKLCTT
jgi:hypothetical protein